MNFDDQIELEHLLFFDRRCRLCGKVKNLLDDFYLTRKDRGCLPSAYSYECKECTIKRVLKSRKKDKKFFIDLCEYPDW
jgi:hypothetical protein